MRSFILNAIETSSFAFGVGAATSVGLILNSNVRSLGDISMASDKILTVIVPSYNMEKYLPKCLGSLVVAPELMEKLEVLVVNDGSKDRTSEIAHEFEAKYPQTFKVIDKPNGHYGSCVNAGLAVANGVYVKILDADDSFDTVAFTDYMSFLVKTVECEWSCKPDMIWNDSVWVDENDVAFRTMRRDVPNRKLLDVEDPIVSLSGFYMHQVAYKTDNLRLIAYRQDEGICYTDNEWCHIPVSTVGKLCYCDVSLYRYLNGREGQSIDDFNKNANVWMVQSVALRMAADAIGWNGRSEKLKAYLVDLALVIILNVYSRSILMIHTRGQDAKLEEFDKKLQSISRALYDNVALRAMIHNTGISYIAMWRKHHCSRGVVLTSYRCTLRLAKWFRSLF